MEIPTETCIIIAEKKAEKTLEFVVIYQYIILYHVYLKTFRIFIHNDPQRSD